MDPLHPSARRETPVVRPATPWDADLLAPHIRKEDEDEVASLASLAPREAIQLSVEYSEPGTAMTATRGDNGIICMWGVGRSDTIGVGHPWLLGSRAIEDVPTQFLRTSRRVVDSWLERWPILTNTADERNVVHLKWLDWLGFALLRRLPEYGHARIPFLQFIRTAECASLLPQQAWR